MSDIDNVKIKTRKSYAESAKAMLDYVENGKTFQTDKIITLPTSIFTDADRWENEMSEIFEKLPLCLATTAELKEIGAYKAADMLGKPVLMVRGKDNIVRAFLNVCAHRGAPVVAEGCGHVRRMSCKYHGWTYDLDGKLIGVADAHTFGDIDKSNKGLTELSCEEKNGLIFVCLTPGQAFNLDDFFKGFLDDFEELGFAGWHFLGSRVLTGANWKIAFDGYMEAYHFAALHPKTVAPRTPSNIAHYQAFGPHLRIGFPQVNISKHLNPVPPEKWGDMEHKGFDFIRILFPNVSVFVANKITQLAQLFPGPTPDQNITILNYFTRQPPPDSEAQEALEGMMDFLYKVVRDEDYWVGNHIQTGLASGAHDTVIFGKNERGNQFFHEYVDWYLGLRSDEPSLF